MIIDRCRECTIDDYTLLTKIFFREDGKNGAPPQHEHSLVPRHAVQRLRTRREGVNNLACRCREYAVD